MEPLVIIDEQSLGPAYSLPGPQVLLIHSPGPRRAALNDALVDAGFDVRVANDRPQALRAVAQTPGLDAALLSLDLMHVDLVAKLRERVPGLFILLLAGRSGREEWLAAYVNGAANLVPDDHPPQATAELLRRSLPRARAMRREAVRAAEQERRQKTRTIRQRLVSFGLAAFLLGSAGGAFVDWVAPRPENSRPDALNDLELRRWYLVQRLAESTPKPVPRASEPR